MSFISDNALGLILLEGQITNAVSEVRRWQQREEQARVERKAAEDRLTGLLHNFDTLERNIANSKLQRAYSLQGLMT
jgi:hypothetical protein